MSEFEVCGCRASMNSKTKEIIIYSSFEKDLELINLKLESLSEDEYIQVSHQIEKALRISEGCILERVKHVVYEKVRELLRADLHSLLRKFK